MAVIFEKFDVVPAKSEEIIDDSVSVSLVPQNLAYSKCREVSQIHSYSLVIGCDTAVIFNNEIMGKPKDKEDAFRMLKLLSGNTHQVISGTAIYYKGRIILSAVRQMLLSENCLTVIYMIIFIRVNPLIRQALMEYREKVLFLWRRLTEIIFNVVGLPVSELAKRIKDIL